MKNLVLSALCLAGLTSATGCIIVADDTSGTGEGDLNVVWSLKSSNAVGAVIPSVCPAGADTIVIFAQRGAEVPFSDKYLCSSPSGLATRLPIGQYVAWIQITDTTGAIKFAESAAYPIEVLDGATAQLPIDIFTDRAFFQASWQLTRGGATTCAAVSADKMSILATNTGGSMGFDDDTSRCVDGEAGKSILTQTPVPIGTTYTVVVAALNTAGQSIGDSAALTNRPLDYGNKFENLGVVTIPIL